MPPIFSFRVTNSSAVMAPDISAPRPYWMPTLSAVCRARMWPGAFSLLMVPHTAAARSGSPQRVPSGLLLGSYTSDAGNRQLLRGSVPGGVPSAPVVLLMTNFGV